MKYIFRVTFFFLLKINLIQAQTATLDWLKWGGTAQLELFGSSAESYDPNGNLYFSGLSYTDTFTLRNFTLTNSTTPWEFVIKYDTNGNIVWSKDVSENGEMLYVWGLAANKDGSFFINGTIQSDTLYLDSLTIPVGGGGGHFFVAKADSNGNFLWAKVATGNMSQGGGAAVDKNGNVYVTGIFSYGSVQLGNYSFSNPLNESSLFVAKYDSNGNMIWANPGYEGGNGISCYLVACDSAGTVYISGGYFGNALRFSSTTLFRFGANETSFLTKYDSNGNLVWAENIGGDESNGPNSIAMDINGNIFLSGIFYDQQLILGNDTLTEFDPTGNNADAFVAKFGSNGNALWARNAKAFSPNDGVLVTAHGDNRVTVVGTFFSDSIGFGNIELANIDSGNSNFFVAQYDANGSPLWAKVAGSNNCGASGGVLEDKMQNIYVFGGYGSNSIIIDDDSVTVPGADNFFLAKITPSAQFANLANDTMVCSGSSVQLGGSPTAQGSAGPYNYRWNPTPGLSCDTCANPTATVTSSTTYYVTVTDSTGASSVGSIDIQVQPVVTPSIVITASENIICAGSIDTFNIIAANPGNTPVYIWEQNGNIVDSNSHFYVTDSLLSTDIVQCIMMSNAACRSIDTAESNTLSIAVNPAPNAAITPLGPVTVCQDDSVQLSATAGNTSYAWSTHDTTQTIYVTASNIYYVTVTSANNCSAVSAPVSVTVNPLPAVPLIMLWGDTLVSTVALDYQWYLNGSAITNANNRYLVITRNGNYKVTVTDSNGCQNISDTLYVVMNAIAEIAGNYGVQLYPNPNNGNFTLRFSDSNPHSFSLMDVSGQLIGKEEEIHNEFDCSIGCSGLYFINIKDAISARTLRVVVTK